jgi:hypothetical protein
VVLYLRFLSLRLSTERNIRKYFILRSYNYIAVIELIIVLHTSLQAVLQMVLLQRVRRLLSNTTVA